MLDLNPSTETGFKRWFVYALIVISIVTMSIVTYNGMDASNKANEAIEKADKLSKQTKEGSELFSKLETIRKEEIKIRGITDNIATLYKEKDKSVEIINTLSKDVKKYGIESTSEFITK